MRFEKIAIAFAVIVALISFMAVFPMPSWWFEIQQFQVRDAVAGQRIILDYQRKIWRDFTGEWRVQIWRSERGEWSSYCTANGGPHGYRADSVLPDPVTLEWLAYTQPRCYQLPKGTYYAALHITVNADGYMQRAVEAKSTAFEVR